MNKRLALIVAVIMGLLAVMLVHIYIGNMRTRVYSGMDMVRILVASEDLQKGDILTDAKVAFRAFPSKYVDDRAIDPVAVNAAMGAQTKIAVRKGAPIFWSDLVTRVDLDAGLAGDLQPNMCAMTIPVTQISGLAGLLQPGMRVNVLFTADSSACGIRSGKAEEISPEEAAAMASSDVETFKATLAAPPRAPASAPEEKKKVNVLLLQDVLILAVGAQRIGYSSARPPVGEAAMYNNVTLMLSPRETQILTLAMTQGQLNLVLRRDGETWELPPPQIVSCDDIYDFIMGD